MNTLLEKKQLNSAVTPEQFCEDIDVLFHTLSLSYGMYEYWGKYAFEEAHSEIVDALHTSWTGLDGAVEKLRSTMHFIKDGHFRIGFEYKDGPVFDYAINYGTMKGIPLIDCKKFFFDSEEEKKQLNDFSQRGKNYQNDEPLIIDLRGNTGGSTMPIYDFLCGLFGKEVGYSFKCRQINSPLFRDYLMEKGIDFDTSEDVEEMESKEPLMENTKPIYVLIDEHTGSAAEEAIAYLKNIDSVTLVGTHSAGCFSSGNAITVYLPNSHLPVHFGTGIVLYEGTRNIDAEGGFQADISYEEFLMLMEQLN